jgi:hypothetical protein
MRTLCGVTLTDGWVPYEPILRLHSRRRPAVSDSTNYASVDLIKWKRHLGFVPNHVVQKTLQATTQIIPTVEAETREIMRDHLQTRLPQLKVCQVNDRCYVDTFFLLCHLFEVSCVGTCLLLGRQVWMPSI